MGGSREGRWKTIRNTFIIFLLSGLWHGANWTYVTWGLYHAILFIPLILFGRTKTYSGVTSLKQIPQVLLTFALVSAGWIIFRAPSINDAYYFISGIFDKSLLSCPLLINRDFYIPTLLSITILLFTEWLNQGRKHGLDVAHINSHVMKFGIYLGILLLLFWLGGEAETFIYFQF